jgi:MoaA/NifB/PqqE/SkfB family radical SAM enzyme
MTVSKIRRRIAGIRRRLREARVVAKALRSAAHPVLAQVIPIRRCNLTCAYCNEYDSISKPVPTGEMLRRIDRLATLGTTIITISGGEPLLHPDLDEIVARIRRHGLIATVITNGYLLTGDRIWRLNRAGLDVLQISIDNVQPDDVSKKSLKVLDQKLRLLAAHAEFDVTINSVIGAAVRHPQDALVIARRAQELGFASTVGVLHDGGGSVYSLDTSQQGVLDQILRLPKPVFSFSRYDHFQMNLARGIPNDWKCHAGSRYLYICEDGLVHWCSQQRGYPGIPLAQYTREHLAREYNSEKPCAPYCTVSCVHQVSLLDEIREQPHGAVAALFTREGAASAPPLPVRMLLRLFVTSGSRHLFANTALRLLRVK